MLVAHQIMPSLAEEPTKAQVLKGIKEQDFDVKAVPACRRVSALSDATTITDNRRTSHDLSGFEPALEDFRTLNKISYSIPFLLQFRNRATPLTIDFDYGDEPRKKEAGTQALAATAAVEGTVRFRIPKDGKAAPRNSISFHQDLDVGEDCIVHVHNISREVGWPQLDTFCTKTVGMKPLNIRMERRSDPCRGMLVFSSPVEARQFVESVPPGARLKGRKLRFTMSTVVVATPVISCKLESE